MAFLDGGLSLKPETLEYLRKKGRLPPQDESPPAELIDAFKQKPPAGMDDAAYQQAADHDKADLGKRQSSDSLNFATALITNTPQYQPKENHESAASAVLKRRQLHEQGQAGEKDLRKFLLTEWYKAKAEGREFNHKAALAAFNQGEEDRRLGEKHKNDLELQDKRDAAALERANLVKPMQGRPTIRQDDDGNMIAVDPNTGASFPVTDERGKPVRANDRGFETDTQRLGEDLKFLGPINRDLALLKQHATSKDQPGVGPIAGRLPDWAISKEGVGFRQSAGRVMNAIIYMTTGKQINEAETARQLEARGLGPKSAAQAYQVGIPELEKELKLAYRTFKAKYEPRVVEEFRGRGGLNDMASLEDGEPAPTAAAPRASGDGMNVGKAPVPKPGAAAPAAQKVRVKDRDGSVLTIPIADLQEALADGATLHVEG
jgi:hypothetical protein